MTEILVCNTCLHKLPHRWTKKGNLVCTLCSAPQRDSPPTLTGIATNEKGEDTNGTITR